MQTGDKKVFKSSDIVFKTTNFLNDTTTNDGVGAVTNSTVQESLRLVQMYVETIKLDLVPGQIVDDVFLSEIRLRSTYFSSFPSALSELSMNLKSSLNYSSSPSSIKQRARVVEIAVPQTSLEIANSDPSMLSTMTLSLEESMLATDEVLLAAIHIRSEDYNTEGLLIFNTHDYMHL